MEMMIHYSKTQLDSAIAYVSKHNKFMNGSEEFVRQQIVEKMEVLAMDQSISTISTMGFLLVCSDCQYESIENDDNECRIEIYVDPSLISLSSKDEEVYDSITIKS
jgi:hypothetical protein